MPRNRSLSIDAIGESITGVIRFRSDSATANVIRRLSATPPAWTTESKSNSLEKTTDAIELMEVASEKKATENIADKNADSDKLTNIEAMIHLLKGNIGPGILALPQAIKYSGILLGTVMIFVLGGICIHCMHQLLRCTRKIVKMTGIKRVTYADVGEYTFLKGPMKLRKFSPIIRFLIKFFLCITQLGFCSVYFLFVTKNVKKVIEHYTSFRLSLQLYMLIMLGPTILYSFIKNLKALAPMAMLASLLQVSGTIIIFYNILQSVPNIESRKYISDPALWPLYFGITLYAFEGIGLVMPIENSMKRPQDYSGITGVMNTGMCLVACLYFSLSFYGYLKYGDLIEDSITLNLELNPYNSFAIIAFATSVWLTYPLQFYVAYEMIWEYCKTKLNSKKARTVGDYILRTLLVTLTFTAAEIIPNLDVVISLVGALGSSTLALIFPPLLECILNYKEDKKIVTRYNLKNLMIAMLGIFGAVIGTYTTLKKVITKH